MKNLKIWSLALALLVSLAGCEKGGDETANNGGVTKAPFKPEASVAELQDLIANKWQLVEYAGQTVNFDVYIDYKEDNTYELYERTYGYEYDYRTGTYSLDGNALTGVYSSDEPWNNAYTIKIAKTNPLRLRQIEANGQYAEYVQVDKVPSNVESTVPEWDGEYRAIPSASASVDGYIEITHPGQFATLLAETDAEAFVAAGKKVRLMKDLYFNNIPFVPVSDVEHFRDFVLDGNGHALYDITVAHSVDDEGNVVNENKVLALFPQAVNVTISDLVISNINVDAGEGEEAYAGGLIGVSYGNLELSNVVVKKSTIKGTNKVGGLVGFVVQDSITATECGVVGSTIETNDYNDESGLAGGLIGYVSCTEETPKASVSTLDKCFVHNTTLNVINSRGDNTRANSEFIGGVGGDDNDMLYITKPEVKGVTLNDSADYKPFHNKLVGGIRGRFTVVNDGVAYYCGQPSDALPEANAKGVVELVSPSHFAAVLTQGAKDLKFTFKYDFDFKNFDVTPLYEESSVFTFHNLVFDGVNGKEEHTISNLNVVKSAAYSALFPNGVDLTIKNLKFDNIRVDAGKDANAYAAVLIARAYGDTVIDNVTISASEVKGTNKVGGFVGLVAEDSLSLTNGIITTTTIETHDVADESGLAGGLIGYIACDDDKLVDVKIDKCTTIENNYIFVNSRNDNTRSNSKFIGGVAGDNGDVLTITNVTDSKSVLTETAADKAPLTYKAMNDYVGGTRGAFTVIAGGVAYWNGFPKALPAPNSKGYIELTVPGEFVTLLNEGATGLKVTLKNSLDFAQLGEEDGKVAYVNGTLSPVVDYNKFRGFEFDGANKTISNYSVVSNGTVAALFPMVADATIKNLVISGAYVDAGVGENAYAAAVIGTSYGPLSLTNVDVKKSTIKGTNKVGALVGLVAEDSIAAKNCDVDATLVETNELADESGLAGGFIGYIGCAEGKIAKSTIDACTVKNSTLKFINSRGNENRANSEFIGAIGGDADDELVITDSVVENNKYEETGADNYTPDHKLIGGRRGEFKVTIDGESIYAVEETPEA